MCGPTNLYKFSHLSLQEFLAAFHITQLSETDQFSAFQLVYNQNPVSPILTFYAGFTKLASENACKLLFGVLTKRLDISGIVGELQKILHPARDIRRQLLALMNCLYKTQKSSLISHAVLTAKEVEDTVICSDNIHVEFPFSFIILYPTDCLSIGYFVRLVSKQVPKSVTTFLNIENSLVGTREIKALCQELHKPSQERRLYLNISSIILTNEAFDSVNTVLRSHGGLEGLIFSGCLTHDMRCALKYIIEAQSHDHTCPHYVSITELNVHLSVIHHLVLLLRYDYLTMLDLAGSGELFKNRSVMVLFCEALKYNTMQRLLLDGCGIDDWGLKQLAGSITEGCLVLVLDTGWNPYTAHGLTEFLEILLHKFLFTCIQVLSISSVYDEHRKLVEDFNSRRKHFGIHSSLSIVCKNDSCSREKDRNCRTYLNYNCN